MKARKILSLLIAGAFCASAVVSVSAAQPIELTNESPSGSTDVTARIEGSAPGEVSYIITIPDSVDFGTLTQPETDADSYRYSGFEVVATEINIEQGQWVSVSVNGDATKEDQFMITQQAEVADPFEINYDIYTGEINDSNLAENAAVNDDPEPGTYGYHFTSFGASAQGSTQEGTLVLNQRALYGQNLDTIAGDYSGTMTFYSAIVNSPLG